MNYIENFDKTELDTKLDIAITWFKKELKDHEKGIRDIWWYVVTLNKEESNFKIEIDEVHTITVQYQDWEFEFIDNHEWIISRSTVDDTTLEKNETLKWNENVNTLNRIIKFYTTYDSDKSKKPLHKRRHLKKAAKLFEIISENK